jgi:5-formyltetrahydrofolate cyclo-ligase
MENIYSKEKKLETVLEKLTNLSRSSKGHVDSIDDLYVEKNQLQSEKNEIETKYKQLLLEYNNLKQKLKILEDKYSKKKQLQEQFSQDINELGEETESLVEEIEKWQM